MVAIASRNVFFIFVFSFGNWMFIFMVIFPDLYIISSDLYIIRCTAYSLFFAM